MANQSSRMANRITPTGLDVEHYVAILVVAALVLLLLIGKGLTGFKVPLTNVRVSA